MLGGYTPLNEGKYSLRLQEYGCPVALSGHVAHFVNQALSCNSELGPAFGAMRLLESILIGDGVIKSDYVDEKTRPGL